MKLNAPLNIQFRRCKLPNRTIELGGLEASRYHGMQEFLPGDLAGLVGLGWCVEYGREDFEGAFADFCCWLDV